MTNYFSVIFALLGSKSENASNKILLNFTPAVNFINILHTNFSYEYDVSAAFPNYMYVEKAAKMMFV